MKKTPQLRERCPEFIEYLMGDIDTHIGFLLACGISLSIARFKPLAVRLIGRLHICKLYLVFLPCKMVLYSSLSSLLRQECWIQTNKRVGAGKLVSMAHNDPVCNSLLIMPFKFVRIVKILIKNNDEKMIIL